MHTHLIGVFALIGSAATNFISDGIYIFQNRRTLSIKHVVQSISIPDSFLKNGDCECHMHYTVLQKLKCLYQIHLTNLTFSIAFLRSVKGFYNEYYMFNA